MKLTSLKLESWGYRVVKNFIILTSTVFVGFTRVTDGHTDGRMGDSIYALYSIYAVARKNY